MKQVSRLIALTLIRSGFLVTLAIVLCSLLFPEVFRSGGSGSGAAGGASAPAVSGFPSIVLNRYLSGFKAPVHIAHAGDGSGRLFVVEKKGVVKVVRNGTVLRTPFLDITALVRSSGSEQGLLCIVFPPDFAVRRHFYVDYTGRSGIGDTFVTRYRVGVNPDIADTAGETRLLKVTQPFQNHNGGQLAFGPDGLLYIGMGDGGSAGDPHKNGQNRSKLLGKILRLDVESSKSPYAVPAGNPFGTEVWAYGLRNPWRFSFDRATGDLYIADVGQDKYEEIDVQPSGSKGGENYGWNIMEGFHCFRGKRCSREGLTLPVAEYDHSKGDCSVTGGFVYRGSRFPQLRGTYVYGDFCSGRIWGLRRNGQKWENRLLLKTSLAISTFGEDEAGEIYVADYARGDIYRIEAR